MIVFGRYSYLGRYFEAEIAGNRGGKVPENKPGRGFEGYFDRFCGRQWWLVRQIGWYEKLAKKLICFVPEIARYW